MVHVPWYLREFTSDGKAQIRLSPTASRAELLLVREPKLPLMNHEAAVKDLLAEFDRTKDYWSEYVRTGQKPASGARPPDEILRLVVGARTCSPGRGARPPNCTPGSTKACASIARTTPGFQVLHSKLVLLANQLHEGIYDRPYVIEGGVYSGFWFESVPVTMQVYARIDLETAKAQLRSSSSTRWPMGMCLIRS